MEQQMFDELLDSVTEGAQILKGERAASREFVFDGPNVRGIRERLQLSQARFAEVLGISAATLRNWEQGRRYPEGPARVLLSIADQHPEVLWNLNVGGQAGVAKNKHG